MSATRRFATACFFLALAGLAGCASAPRDNSDGPMQSHFWSGRLLLRVSSDPPQVINAAFELRGLPVAGSLVLTGPLGNVAATLQWTGGGAMLHRAGQTGEAFASLDALAQQVTGTAFPIAALFDWLAGLDTQASGWRADLSRLGEGRLSASRNTPEPPAQLQIVLESSAPP